MRFVRIRSGTFHVSANEPRVFLRETFRTDGPMQIGRTEQVRFSTVRNNKKSPASDFSHPSPNLCAHALNDIQFSISICEGKVEKLNSPGLTGLCYFVYND